MEGCIVQWLHLFDFSPVCFFMCVLKLPAPDDSHTGCICWTFLQCVFSCVSSSYLPEMMHSYTDCICWTFLQCAFSCVSSNCLREKLYNHNGCICLTFLQ